MKKKILFITGSINQTSQMYQIASHLGDCDCWFSQIFADTPLLKGIQKYTPFAEGSVRGIALVPLYPSAPAAALRNPALYENLALFDALRMGNARERNFAEKLLKERL